MHKKILMLLLVSVVSLSNYAFWAAPVFAQAPTIVSTSPVQNELNVLVCKGRSKSVPDGGRKVYHPSHKIAL